MVTTSVGRTLKPPTLVRTAAVIPKRRRVERKRRRRVESERERSELSEIY